MFPTVNLTWHDFTPQAQQKVAGAYALFIKQLTKVRTNAKAQEQNSFCCSLKDCIVICLLLRGPDDATKTAQQYDAAAATK